MPAFLCSHHNVLHFILYFFARGNAVPGTVLHPALPVQQTGFPTVQVVSKLAYYVSTIKKSIPTVNKWRTK
jgi:hypothetical protein